MLDKQIKNKKIEREDVEVKTAEVVLEQHFYFPDYNLTINALSKEEAEKKLAEILEAKQKNYE